MDNIPPVPSPEGRPKRTISRTSARMQARKMARRKAAQGSEKMSNDIEQHTMTSDHVLDLYQRAQRETDPEVRHRLMAQVRSMSSQLEAKLVAAATDIVNSLLEETPVYGKVFMPEEGDAAKTKPLKWARMDLEDTEPDVRSEDGRFEITPLYIGRETPQRWALRDTQSGETVKTNTLAQAKERADRLSGHIAKKKSWVASTEEEFRRNYEHFMAQAGATTTDEYAKKIALRGAEQVRKNAEAAGIRLSPDIH